MKARRVKKLDPDRPLAENARRIVAVRLAELRSFVPRALDPEEVEALHDMRIAAKRLRYVLELTEPALGPGAAGGAQAAKGLQDLLGEIHDCDVMGPRLREHVERLRSEDAAALRERAAGAKDLEPEAARDAPNRARHRGVESLIAYYAARRGLLFDRFTEEWQQLVSGALSDALLDAISEPEPAPSGPQVAEGR